jgi:hypothetical protein
MNLDDLPGFKIEHLLAYPAFLDKNHIYIILYKYSKLHFRSSCRAAPFPCFCDGSGGSHPRGLAILICET